MNTPFYGNMDEYGLKAGFMPSIAPQGQLPESRPIIERWQTPEIARMDEATIDRIERGDFGNDMGGLLKSIMDSQRTMERSITSATSNLPIRENLEAEAKLLIPTDTPFRNRLRRTPGTGLNSRWKQILSLGGGYMAASTTVGSSIATATTFTVASGAGIVAGDQLAIDSGVNFEIKTVVSVNQATGVVTVSALGFAHANGVGVIKYGQQGGSSQGVVRSFFAETGSPQDHTTIYAEILQSYKLMGVFGSVTGFAMAAGANFQNQYVTEKGNSIKNLMLNEENALINGDATNILFPWGDGTNALSFNGIVNLITTANGTPAPQVQTAVGALTLAHIDGQINRQYLQGSQNLWMLMNPQECASLAHIATATGAIQRVMFTPQGHGVLGIKITGYTHPTTGALIEIIPSRFLAPGTIIFGCDNLPDGSPALDVDVLPQVQLPALAPNDNVQGYTAQDLAPGITAPQVYPWIVSVYETLRLKSALHFCKSTGVLAV